MDIHSQVSHAVSVELIVGMVGKEGVSLQDHDAYVSLQEEPPACNVKVSYTTGGRSVHTKLYVWSRDGVPIRAFAGSSNFTQNGFLIGWRRDLHSELLSDVTPHAALEEYRRIETDTLLVDHPEVRNEVRVWVRAPEPAWPVAVNDEVDNPTELAGVSYVVLPLVALRSSQYTVRGHPHRKWGLNWGQRDERARNQAVIHLPAQVRRATPEFFPRGTPGDRPQFLVSTDDNKSLFMVVAEQGDKALHSIPSNSLLGEYFRNRLGVASEAEIVLADLERAGSRFVKIYRTAEESYHLEYSPEVEVEGAVLYGL